jgi:hypothetical protein
LIHVQHSLKQWHTVQCPSAIKTNHVLFI